MNTEEKEWGAATGEDQRQAVDWRVWEDLADWARRRAARMLRLMEGDGITPLDSGESREADLLYVEVHQYFGLYEHEDTGMEAEGAGKIDGSLAILCRTLRLEDFEIFCLIFAMLAELDSRFERLFIYLNNNWSEPYLNIEWAIRLFLERLDADPRYLQYFFPEGRLCRYLFELAGESGSRLRKGLKLRPVILRYIITSGAFRNNEILSWYPDGSQSETQGGPFIPEDERKQELQTLLWKQEKQGHPLCIQIKGRGFMRKLSYAVWYAARRQQKVGVIRYPATGWPEPEDDTAVFLEIAVYNGIPCIIHREQAVEEEQGRKRWIAFLEKAMAYFPVVFILSEEDAPALALPVPGRMICLVLPLPDDTERLAYWRKTALRYQQEGYTLRNPETEGNFIDTSILERAAGQYTFLPEELEEIFERAIRMAGGEQGSVITEDILFRSCRQQVKHSLSDWAVRVETGFCWEDLVLSEEQRKMLEEAAAQIRYRNQVYHTWGFSRQRSYGTGLSILFTGPPGTGKTMAAQVLSGALGMDLYKLQLPALVSKYIGETEKNLRTVFREGEKSQAVLFFDEADVLFSKRTEVKDSHDKYSNMEAAYMLQRLEEYPGVVILATNFPQNIDPAFKRRITFTIEFYMPDSRQRCLLWEKSIPEELPTGEDIDIKWLAEQFELSGSNIKNVILNAAFLAASKGEVVCMCHIIRALRAEYRKSGAELPECHIPGPDKTEEFC